MSFEPGSIGELQEKIGYVFKDPELLHRALTHSSLSGQENYERLEFLGDRVLGLVIATLLFKNFPEEKEGDMAKRLALLVQGKTLAQLSGNLSLGDYILLSSAEAASGGAKNDHILADVFEALIGALYIDGGYEPCSRLIETHWQDVIYTMHRPPQHPKTAVQEWAQGQGLPLPDYEIISQSGPAHAPVFEVRLSIKGHPPITAKGLSLADAEKKTAAEFMTGIPEEEQ
ncbi:MAG: ribonuclease III [Alphaproteobacteria bacterium]|nr:ribonuclease III [Alphaproteobacteria bacterium]